MKFKIEYCPQRSGRYEYDEVIPTPYVLYRKRWWGWDWVGSYLSVAVAENAAVQLHAVNKTFVVTPEGNIEYE